MEAISFKYKYAILVFGKSGKSYNYGIGANTDLDALDAAKKFFPVDYPEDEIRFMEILKKEEI